MDNYLILSFPTKAQAETCLKAINSLAAQWWQSQGYTVVDGQLVGKNAATGQDEPESAKTITWGVVKESPDGTFYLPSLRNDPRFIDGLEMLPADVQGLYEERTFPDAWKTEIEA